MSPNNDIRRLKTAASASEAVDFPASGSLARTLQAASLQMRPRVILPLAVAAAVVGAALLLNGILPGAALLAGAPLLLARRRKRAGPLDRSAVRLALRLAKVGQRTLLVETGSRVRVVRMQDAADGPRLQYIAALANGALILARARQ
jgi:hypothetical protein